MSQHYEVAVSQFTCIGSVIDHQMLLAPCEVDAQEMAELIRTYELRYMQPTLHLNKSIALGSPNLFEGVGEPTDTRMYFAMVVCRIDGHMPVLAHIPPIADTFALELREHFMRPQTACADQAPSISQI